MFSKTLLGAVGVLTVLLGLALWRIDALSESRAEAVKAATKAAQEVQRLSDQREADQRAARRLRQDYEDLHTSNLNLRERLRHEEDGPAAPVLRCAVDERLCSGSASADRNPVPTP